MHNVRLASSDIFLKISVVCSGVKSTSTTILYMQFSESSGLGFVVKNHALLLQVFETFSNVCGDVSRHHRFKQWESSRKQRSEPLYDSSHVCRSPTGLYQRMLQIDQVVYDCVRIKLL